MRDLMKRALTGSFVVLLTVLAVYAGGGYVVCLFAVVMNIGLHEWQGLCKRLGYGISPFWLFFLGNLAYADVVSCLYAKGGFLDPVWPSVLSWGIVLVVAALFVSTIFQREDAKHGKVWLRIGLLLGGVLYIGVSLALLNALSGSFHEDGPHVLMGFFLLIWAGDVFAYLVGSMLGRHKLCERLSPSKTWEGAAGGFLFAMSAGLLWGIFVLEKTPLGLWMGMSVLLVLCGMLGDLVESKIKREAGVKDSGTILPGHGGVLDRFDSVLVAAPVAVSFWQLASMI